MHIQLFAPGHRRRCWYTLAAALLSGTLLAGCASAPQRVQRSIAAAWRDGTAIPLAHLIDETLTIESAYQIQRRLVRTWPQPAAGFKGGLTSAAAQQRFRATTAVAGVLPAAGLRPARRTRRVRA